jgi:hypothetical protein
VCAEAICQISVGRRECRKASGVAAGGPSNQVIETANIYVGSLFLEGMSARDPIQILSQREELMIRPFAISRAALANAVAASLFATVVAA